MYYRKRGNSNHGKSNNPKPFKAPRFTAPRLLNTATNSKPKIVPLKTNNYNVKKNVTNNAIVPSKANPITSTTTTTNKTITTTSTTKKTIASTTSKHNGNNANEKIPSLFTSAGSDKNIPIKQKSLTNATNTLKNNLNKTNIVQRKNIVPFKKKFSVPRMKLPRANNGSSSSSSSSFKPTTKTLIVNNNNNSNNEKQYYTAMYTKDTRKKRKVWHDGIIILNPGKKCYLQDMTGKDMRRTSTGFQRFAGSEEISVGPYDVEIVSKINADEYTSGRIFMSSIGNNSANSSANINGNGSSSSSNMMMSSSGVKKTFKLPGGASSNLTNKKKVLKDYKALHDPNAPNALILDQGIPNKRCPIVVAPFLCDWLRPHQRDGVQFLFKCVTGQGKFSGNGCILADEMGLGKTLQSITLVWTLLKQGPQGASNPYCKRVLIVTPSSLVGNWGQEFVKWLSTARCNPLVINKAGKEAENLINDFTYGSSKVRPVLIVSYEMACKYISTIRKAKVGLVICDEAHRLKNSKGNKTINALKSIGTSRRVLLTGTPVQNKLEEFFAMADYCNPSILQDLVTFKRIYQGPIENGRDKRADSEAKRLGVQRSNQLAEFTEEFVLRRSSDLLKKFLPPKTNITVFCSLSKLQYELYSHITNSQKVRRYSIGGRSGSMAMSEGPLVIIQDLVKLCNHPDLLKDRFEPLPEEEEDQRYGNFNDANKSYFVGTTEIVNKHEKDTYFSGKFFVLTKLLDAFRNGPTKDRVVLVSQFTKTLEIMARLCKRNNWPHVRLDGSTKQSDRQNIVNNFNAPHSDSFVFLLSARAGGAGLNLIGANRLILFDPSWNPAIDQQAMARIWRDGQKKDVYIYRLLSTGTVEEKIFQRQILKQEFASVLKNSTNKGGSKEKSRGQQQQAEAQARHFSPGELKQLFLPPVDTKCQTYDLIQNMNSRNKFTSSSSKPVKNNIDGERNEDLEEREELFPNYNGPEDITDEVLKNEVENDLANVVTFVHTKISSNADSDDTNNDDGGGGGGESSSSVDDSDKKSGDCEETSGKGNGTSSKKKRVWVDDSDDDDDDED